MSKILRAVQKIFGADVTAAGNVAQFGSLKAGAAAYTKDPKVLQALAAFGQAWNGATIGNNSPPKQDRNALDYLFSYQLAYLLQSGMAEYDPDTVYFKGNVVSDGGVPPVFYYSVVDNNAGNPLVNGSFWLPYGQSVAPRQSLLKAWVYFNGQGAIPGVFDSWNVASVVKNGTGDYTINFPAPGLDYANYGYSFGCMQENALAATVMVTRFPGDVKTQTQFRVRSVSNFDSSPFDLPEVAVSIYSA